MKRWFIARMGEWIEPGDVVPKTALYFPSGQLRPQPLNPEDKVVPTRQWSRDGLQWCFGQLGATSITEMQADPDIYILPEGVMGMSVGSIPAGTRTTMKNRLEGAGFTFTDVKTNWTVGQLLGYLRMQIQPQLGDNVEDGDVREIEG